MNLRLTRISAALASLIIAVLMLTAFGGTVAVGQDFDFGDFNLISVEEEIEIGKELSGEIEKEYQLC